ncbi:hypothetical protein CALVIDRAFT_72169 [Calocera viscosa TUFC12733]|uniref:Ras-GEF domain-containing protein n=1 Tax=Calocera viscosa (strain TUFC12733) TaxID=1330018 RepID=A0A167NBQ4_CALVF|nr:hypothetical protein CALVIDRAFT_72169 [Calocera viscosa TUFC12733]
MLPPSLPLSALPPAYISLALTLLSSQLFASVEPRDVLARLAGLRALKAEWAGELPEPQPPQQGGEDSLARWVEVNTRLGVWASGEVLRGKGRRGRARALERLIDCAEGCRKLSNHSSMSTLLSALNAPPISRLMHTWALVSSHHLELLPLRPFPASLGHLHPRVPYHTPDTGPLLPRARPHPYTHAPRSPLAPSAPTPPARPLRHRHRHRHRLAVRHIHTRLAALNPRGDGRHLSQFSPVSRVARAEREPR